MKSEVARYRARAKVSELSSKIPVILVADAFHILVCNTLTVGTRDCKRLAEELKSVTRHRKDELRTRKSHNAPSRVWINESEKGKAIQMALWQSNKSIVAMKSNPLCRGLDEAKRLTEMRWDLRNTTASYRAGVQLSTKLKSSNLQDGS
jgi:hypothetical protein